MAANWGLALLGALGTGASGLPEGLAEKKKLDLAEQDRVLRERGVGLQEQQLVETKRQHEATMGLQRDLQFEDIPHAQIPTPFRAGLTPDDKGNVRVSKNMAALWVPMWNEERKLAAENVQRGNLQQAVSTLAFSPGGEVRDPDMAALHAVIRSLPYAEAAKRVGEHVDPAKKFGPMSEYGAMNLRTGQPVPGTGPAPVAPLPPKPGYISTYGQDAKGRPTEQQKPIEARDDYDRMAQQYKAPDGTRYFRYEDMPSALQQEVYRRVAAEKLQRSREQGAAGVDVKASAERQQPLVQSLPSNKHIVDARTGVEVDQLDLTLEQARSAKGQYRVVDTRTKDALVSIAETSQILGQYAQMSQALATQPGANFAQAAKMYMQTKLGIPNAGVDFAAMHGSVLRLAGAMEGSRVHLSDQDRKAVEGMLPTQIDTVQTAMQRLARVSKLLVAMRDAQLGIGSAAAVDAILRGGSAGSPVLVPPPPGFRPVR